MSIIIGTDVASKRFNELCNVFLAWFLQTWELIMVLKMMVRGSPYLERLMESG